MRFLAGTIAMLMSAAPIAAQSIDPNTFMKANDAGQIVGGADICGYQLDDEKTKSFMENTVAEFDDASRMHFNNVRSSQAYILGQMGATEKKAQCSLQAKLAQKYGLTP